MTNLLQYTQFGQGEPLVILHGLFGSSKNWQSLSRQYGEKYSVYAVDLRNHGNSFHDPVMNYQAMAEDVFELLEHLAIDNIRIIGHSMGGKVAMTFGYQYPQKVFKLVIADIAPLAYRHSHSQLIAPILAINLTEISSRSEVDQRLKADIPDPVLRGFLLQNLVREADSWCWKVNWSAIQEHMHQLVGFPLSAADWKIDIPTLFVRGENSDYVDGDGIAAIERHFSQVTVETIKSAGHWLHAEQPGAFSEVVMGFL